MPNAMTHQARRRPGSAKPPTSQNTPEQACQTATRWKLRRSVLLRAQDEHEVQRAPELHDHEGDGEHRASAPKARGIDTDSSSPSHHQHEQRHAHRRTLRVGEVREPNRIDPHQPYGHQQQPDLQRLGPAQVGKQRVRQLRHREHEHEIKEQFGHADAAAVGAGFAQQRARLPRVFSGRHAASIAAASASSNWRHATAGTRHVQAAAGAVAAAGGRGAADGAVVAPTRAVTAGAERGLQPFGCLPVLDGLKLVRKPAVERQLTNIHQRPAPYHRPTELLRKIEAAAAVVIVHG